MRMKLTFGLLAILATVSCSGGSATPPANVPDPTTITGTIEITGSLLANLEDTQEVGIQDAKNWSVKLIDPVESIDSIMIPVANTTFNSPEVSTAGEYLLEVSFLPAVDLSGGSSATTPVTVNIPVLVVSGEETQVFASVQVIAPLAASTIHTASQVDGGGRLRLRYTVETGSTRDTGFVEIDWVNRRMRHDTNHDELFDDEDYFADSDRDGISDELRDQMRDRMHQTDRFTIEGELVEFDRQHHRILVGGRWYRVNELTRVFRLDRHLHLGDLEVGQNLSITWTGGREDLRFAREIRIVLPMDMPPMG